LQVLHNYLLRLIKFRKFNYNLNKFNCKLHKLNYKLNKFNYKLNKFDYKLNKFNYKLNKFNFKLNKLDEIYIPLPMLRTIICNIITLDRLFSVDAAQSYLLFNFYYEKLEYR